MDLAYLTGQRSADTLRMTAHDIIDGHLIITEEKTKQPLRIVIRGALAELLERIAARKETHSTVRAALLTNTHGKRLTAAVLRNHFDEARTKAEKAVPHWRKRSGHFGSTTCGQRQRTTQVTTVETKQQAICWGTTA
jgi:integrase